MTNNINVLIGKKTYTGISTSRVVSGGVEELDQLTDVDTSLEEDGSVLQYNATTQTYQIKPLVVGFEVVLDAGEF